MLKVFNFSKLTALLLMAQSAVLVTAQSAALASMNDGEISKKALQTRCFEFKASSPARDVYAEASIIGCYMPVSEDEELVFQKDQDGPHLLTSALAIKTDDSFELKHFSKSFGALSLIKQERFLINPLSIPLSLEEVVNSPAVIRELRDLDIYSVEFKNRLKGIYKQFNSKEPKLITVKDLKSPFPVDSAASVEEFYLPEKKQPTDGYWWPHVGIPLANGPSSPMGKYDAYVEKASGNNPNSVDWEHDNHHSDVVWAGHCNGWASAAILHGYDDANLVDETNGNIITSSELQGLRAAVNYCTSNAFYGTRYRGENSEVKDIYAHNFHFVLKFYLKRLQKPVVADFLNSSPVDSDIISGYKFTYEQTDTPNKYLVTAKIKVHKNADTFVHEKRIAEVYYRTYQYYLWKSDYGTAVKGQWLDETDHPDFLWIPLKDSRCGRENPRVKAKWIEHMLESLERTDSK